jgi:hypothetical protein
VVVFTERHAQIEHQPSSNKLAFKGAKPLCFSQKNNGAKPLCFSQKNNGSLWQKKTVVRAYELFCAKQ